LLFEFAIMNSRVPSIVHRGSSVEVVAVN
jgi:hypothetical protein